MRCTWCESDKKCLHNVEIVTLQGKIYKFALSGYKIQKTKYLMNNVYFNNKLHFVKSVNNKTSHYDYEW